MNLWAGCALCLVVAGSVACGSTTGAKPDATAVDWWDTSFSKRQKLRFAIASGEALKDFPVLISLSANRFNHEAAKASGEDLRFVDPDGTVLAHEIESWNPLGTSQVWVRVPQIDQGSTEDFIWMYYGKEAADSVESPSEVWSDEYQAVWHLGGDPSATTSDSTGNGNHGSAGGAMTADNMVPGQIGGAVSFSGDGEWIEVPHSDSLDITGDKLTLSAWVYMSGPQLRDTGVIVKAEPPAGEVRIYNYQIGVQSDHQANFRVARSPDGLGGQETYLTHDRELIAGTWYYLTGVYDGALATVSVDAQVGQSESAEAPILSTTAPLMIGRRGVEDDRFFVGYIDEARVSTVARSDAWLRAQYQSMTDELVAFGAEESR